MTELNFTYSEEELGWVSDELLLTGNIALRVKLAKRGYIVIKEVLDTESPIIEVSPYVEEAVYNICLHKRGGDAREYKIKVYCGCNEDNKPEKIEYANL